MLPLNAAGRIGLSVLLLLAGVIALHLGQSIFVPMLISLLLATVLGPAATWLHRGFKIRWGVACITVVLSLVLANILIMAVFSTSVLRLANQLTNEDKVLQMYNDFRTKLKKISPVELDAALFPESPEKINDIGSLKYLKDAVPYIVGQATKYTSMWSAEAIIILFITFFLLLEGSMLARRAVAIIGPSAEVQEKARAVLFEMAEQVRTYVVWRTIINLGLAIVMGSIYSMAGLSQAWTWAILLAILNYIPYLGPVLASVPPFLDAFILSDPAVAVVITVVFWIVVIIEGYLIVPLLMGRSMDLNATTVMMACLFWEAVWGPTGLFMAMPIMAGIKAILYHVPEWRPWANLMSTTEDDLPQPPPDAPPALVNSPAGSNSPNGKLGEPHADGQPTRHPESGA
jgi:predicted PurR-regulated permease PerM